MDNLTRRDRHPSLPRTATTGFWDALFDAVKSRLVQVAAGRPDKPLQAADQLVWTRSGLLECVDALDRLQAMVVDERDRHRQLEHDVSRAQDALANALRELVGARAGEQRAAHLARHDGLTALPNRSHFHERLEEALVTLSNVPRHLAVLYLDLDGFKCVNDEHGHETGDELLRIVASRLARAVRDEDVVGRLGGDEFACLLTTPVSRQQLHHVAIKLFDTVSAPLRIGAVTFNIRPSIGIARSPTDSRSTTALLACADTAMYHAKRHGMGYAFFDEINDTPGLSVRPVAAALPVLPGNLEPLSPVARSGP